MQHLLRLRRITGVRGIRVAGRWEVGGVCVRMRAGEAACYPLYRCLVWTTLWCFHCFLTCWISGFLLFQDGRNVWPWFPAPHTVLWRKWSTRQIWWHGTPSFTNEQQPGFRFVSCVRLCVGLSLRFVCSVLYCHTYLHSAAFTFLRLNHDYIVFCLPFALQSLSSPHCDLLSLELVYPVSGQLWLGISTWSFSFCVWRRLHILCLILFVL